MGTEICCLGGYGFRGTVTAGDGLNQKGENGSRVTTVCESSGAEGKKRQQRKMGREEEGFSSNFRELAAFVLALRDTFVPAKTPKIQNSNLRGFELPRPSSKGTKLLLQVIKAIVNHDKATL